MATTHITDKNTAAPLFDIKDKSDNEDHLFPEEVSFFEVKELYDRAYDARNAGREDFKAKEMMAQAIKMDMAYRCQLARHTSYKKPSKINDFRIMSQAS